MLFYFQTFKNNNLCSNKSLFSVPYIAPSLRNCAIVAKTDFGSVLKEAVLSVAAMINNESGVIFK